MKTIQAAYATSQSFKDFGKVIIVENNMKPDAETDIQTYYGQLAIMNCENSLQVGIYIAKNCDLVVKDLERHADTPELLVALEGDFVTPVTVSKEQDGEIVPDMDKLCAIVVKQGQGIMFNEGVWHWSPYAVTQTCNVLVVFKKDTPKNDFIAYQLKEDILMTL